MLILLKRNSRFCKLLISISVLLGMALPHAGMAQPPNRTLNMKLGLGAASFNYEETLGGSQVNAEDGILPGLYISFKEYRKRVYGEFVLTFYGGNVDYAGQAQDSLGNFLGLVTTDTDTQLLDLNYRVGSYYTRALELYGGLGYRYWQREINPASLSNGTPVAGLLERFTWFYGLAGASYHFNTGSNMDIAVNLQARRMFRPKVNAKNPTIIANIEPDEKWGYELTVPVTIRIRSPYTLTIEPFYKQWRLDQASDSSGNTLPDNDTDTYGVNFILGW